MLLWGSHTQPTTFSLLSFSLSMGAFNIIMSRVHILLKSENKPITLHSPWITVSFSSFESRYFGQHAHFFPSQSYLCFWQWALFRKALSRKHSAPLITIDEIRCSRWLFILLTEVTGIVSFAQQCNEYKTNCTSVWNFKVQIMLNFSAHPKHGICEHG